jgi:hypothetical protein
LGGPKLLERNRAQVRDDLLFGELAIAFQRFRRQTLAVLKPCAQILSYHRARGVDGGSVLDLAQKAD